MRRDIDFQSHELSRVSRQAVVLAFGEAPLDDEVLSLDVAEVAHSLEE
jgi:hypothetical protein